MNPPPELTRELYLEWRAPRVGKSNPEDLTNPVWSWLAREPELSAYQANRRFDGPSSFGGEPAWCCARFGQSRTELADGRVVRIAGEHEDHYDPDFYIYNDVIVDRPDGSLAIYGYPHEDFAPTDFHSATPVGDEIFVIGNLGYSLKRRLGATPIACLDTRTFSMRTLAAEGTPPGWIHGHSATLSGDTIVVAGGTLEVESGGERCLIDSPDDWSLALAPLRWSRLTERRWQQWELARADGRSNELWRRDMAYRYGGDGSREQDRFFFEPLGDPAAVLANRSLHDARYSPPLPHERLPDGDDVPLVLRRVVEGVVVRYVEESYAVRVIVEGELQPAVVDAILDDACHKLAALEGCAWHKRRVI